MTLETKIAVTVAEFEAYIAHPDNAERHLELIHGEIVEEMPTEEHSIIAGNIYFRLRSFAEPKNLGRVAFEVRRQVPDDEQNARIPDVDFTSADRVKARGDVVREGPVLQMPDLAVEIQSPGQSDKLMADKADYYLANGTRLVWLVYPRKKLVEVLSVDARQLLTGDEMLDGGDVLPGFSMRVSDLFTAG